MFNSTLLAFLPSFSPLLLSLPVAFYYIRLTFLKKNSRFFRHLLPLPTGVPSISQIYISGIFNRKWDHIRGCWDWGLDAADGWYGKKEQLLWVESEKRSEDMTQPENTTNTYSSFGGSIHWKSDLQKYNTGKWLKMYLCDMSVFIGEFGFLSSMFFKGQMLLSHFRMYHVGTQAHITDYVKGGYLLQLQFAFSSMFPFSWQYWRVEWGLNLGRVSDRWAIAPRPIFLKFKQEVVFLWILNLFLKSKNNHHIASTGT